MDERRPHAQTNTTTNGATNGVGEPLATGLRVIEIGESIAAAVVGMVLADQGADVAMVEPPGGSRLRAAPAFTMWARGKRSVPLDLRTAGGQEGLAALAAAADVAVVALEPATADALRVSAPHLTAHNDALVHCEITGFGRGHPLSHVAGHEAVVAARAGRAHEFSVLLGGTRPAFPAVPVATHGAAMLALQGVFAALRERELTGRGQRVETSLLRALSVFDLSGWAPGADRALRLADVPILYYFVGRTRDGVWVQFSQNAPRLFAALLRALDLQHLVTEPRFAAAPYLAPEEARAFRALLLERLGERTWDEWRAVFDADPDVSAEPFGWPGEGLQHPQLRHTGDVREVADRELGTVLQLGPLATFAATPALDARPAPRLGDGASPGWAAPARTPAAPAPVAAPRLLEGVTVVEMATWIATPMATGLLAELGARVVKVEPLDGDPMRRHGPVSYKTVQGKESLALDIKTDEGREIVHALVAQADVFAHNYRPGVPERLGIDAKTLLSINPRLVHLYAASYGSTGPMSALPAFHVTAGAICGGALAQCGGSGPPGPEAALSPEELAWWSQRLTRANEANPDFNAALAAAAAITMALFAVRRSGRGQAVETRMMLSNAYTLSEHFVDYEGRPPRRFADGELHGLHACYRLYEAAEGWVFLAAPGDAAFRRLCDALGRDDLARDHRFADAPARDENDAALADALQSVFTRDTADAWQQSLTDRGVACVAVNTEPFATYVLDAPWAEELRFVGTAAGEGAGPYRRYGRTVLTEHDLGTLGAAHPAGAQTRSLLAELGYTDDRVDALLRAGVVGEPQVTA
jgi:crotonobetainyl-CoA:carnitine CoA-transferase CaiB-like acyl-CoA transferase